jgi:putative membrane protein
MSMGETQGTPQKRILILCVDRDGDLGSKAGIKTPVVGREQNLDAAVTLALHDPEETDANAMFEAVRTYDHLTGESKPEEAFEIATMSGSERGGVSADRKLVTELSELLGLFPANEIILVTDGYSDEAVLPLVESRVPVTSVRRIVVKHSERIEETAALLAKYLKMIAENPRYSRFILGMPGLLVLIFAILSFFGQVGYYLLFIGIVLSAVMIGKGFGVDRAARNLYKWSKEYSPPPLRVQISGFSAIVGVLCIVVGSYLGVAKVPAYVSVADVLGDLPTVIGYFIQGAIDLVVVGICVALSGRAIRWYLERDTRVLRNVALIVSIAWSRQILYEASRLLVDPSLPPQNLIFAIVVGILIGIASVLVIIVIHRSAGKFFEGTGEQVEDLGES